MPKLVRNNPEVLFLSGSGEKGSVIAVSVPAALGCGSINLSLPVCYAQRSEIIIINSKQGITKLGCANGIPNVRTTLVDNQTATQY